MNQQPLVRVQLDVKSAHGAFDILNMTPSLEKSCPALIELLSYDKELFYKFKFKSLYTRSPDLEKMLVATADINGMVLYVKKLGVSVPPFEPYFAKSSASLVRYLCILQRHQVYTHNKYNFSQEILKKTVGVTAAAIRFAILTNQQLTPENLDKLFLKSPAFAKDYLLKFPARYTHDINFYKKYIYQIPIMSHILKCRLPDLEDYIIGKKYISTRYLSVLKSHCSDQDIAEYMLKC